MWYSTKIHYSHRTKPRAQKIRSNRKLNLKLLKEEMVQNWKARSTLSEKKTTKKNKNKKKIKSHPNTQQILELGILARLGLWITMPHKRKEETLSKYQEQLTHLNSNNSFKKKPSLKKSQERNTKETIIEISVNFFHSEHFLKTTKKNSWQRRRMNYLLFFTLQEN